MRSRAAGLVVFAVLSFAGNELGSWLRYPDIGAAVLFPPYAVLTAALVVNPRRDWLGYIVVAFIAHFITHWPEWSLSWVLMASVANIARALTAATLLRYLLGGATRIDSIPALALFLFSAAVVGPAVGATLGAASVVVHGASETFTRPWLAWFVSNAITGLVMLPVLLRGFAYLSGSTRPQITRAGAIEALLLAFALGVACALAFLTGPGWRNLALPLYAPLPVLIWAALRFGSSGASLAQTVVTLSAILSVDLGTGPFPAAAPDENIFAVQIFVLLTATPVLCLASVATGRREAVHLYRSLLASIQDQVAIVDARGILIEANESWLRHSERTDVPVYHRVRPGVSYIGTCRTAAGQGDTIAARLLQGMTVVLNRERQQFEIEYDGDRAGQRETFVLSFEALDHPEGGAVAIRYDVTARRKDLLEIDAQRRELSHLARVSVLGQLSGAIAHELNQPLAAILSNAEAARHLLRRQPVDFEQLDDIMADIVSDDQRAAAVIQRLRALLKRGERHVQLVNVRELVDDVMAMARMELISRRVVASAVVDPALPIFPGDKIQLQQVLLNLILNACEAMSTTPEADRRVTVRASAGDDGNLDIAVRDTGTGIPPDLIDRLFEPFVTTKAQGLGLGLSISSTIMAAHGGRLWAENNSDRGATVHCVIAMTAAPPGSGPAQEASFAAT